MADEVIKYLNDILKAIERIETLLAHQKNS